MAHKSHRPQAFRRFLDNIREKSAGWFRRFGQQTDTVLVPDEPIDFSAPSVPYYTNLADRFSFARIILYMVLFVFVVVTLLSNRQMITYSNLYYLVKDIGSATLTSQSEADYISYPTSTATADFDLFRGGLIVAGGEEVHVLSGSGKQTQAVNVAYTSPSVRTSDKFFLTFDRGAPGFSVYNAFVRVYSEKTEFPVYDACVADNGNFAILTRSRDYTSEVLLYNADMKKLAGYHLNGHVTAMTMNPAGHLLAVVSAESVGGQWETKVTVIRIDRHISRETAVLPDTFAASAAFLSDDRLAIVEPDHLLILKPDASITSETDFHGQKPTLCAFGNGRVAILLKSHDDLNKPILSVWDKSGRNMYRIPLPAAHASDISAGTVQMVFGENALFLFGQGQLLRISPDGKSVLQTEISRDVLDVLPLDGEQVLVCGPAYAKRLTQKDFRPLSS